MIGIDIVDLNDPLFRERTPRSLQLILSKDDQLIEHPKLFWLLWSAKEAIFKSYRAELTFNPTQIPVKLENNNGDIFFSSGKVTGQIFIKDHFILAIAKESGSGISYRIFEENTKDWSNTIREKVTHHFTKKGFQISMDRDPIGLPVLAHDRTPISFTHHGKFGAFAYAKSA
ncbi:MAG: 4'-phosphopantetheinyl transferase superfamily protein [Cyclobacteriaceae bacterium]